jgi:predicted NBD/HSP70 family sugar kinase
VTNSPVNPALLGRLNVRRVLEVVQRHGPLSRAEVTRRSGVSAPTVSKAVGSLLKSGLLEEGAPPRAALGRPGRILQLATRSARVLGIVLDADRCAVLASGLDGRILEERVHSFPTPGSYAKLIDALVRRVEPLLDEEGVSILGLGISMPGLIDRATGEGVLSPNLHATDGRAPGRDLAGRLGIECVVRQESHGLCLAEWFWGEAQGLNDFAMLDVSTGLGLGVMSGGRILEGSTGLAGELGHMTIDLHGRLCGCGNRGCLETLATDSALARAVSERLRRPVGIDEAVRRFRAGAPPLKEALYRTLEYLAVAIGAVINTFNPSTLLVHGRLLEAGDGLFGTLLELVRRRTLSPSLQGCTILRAKGNKRQGAVAGIISHVLDSLAPRLAWPAASKSPN